MMKCPDRKVLARFCDGEAVVSRDELRKHVEGCARCRIRARQQDQLGMLMEAALKKRARSMVKESIPCPSAEEVALYIEGGVPLYRKKQLIQHFCACPACARAALDAARAGGRISPPLPAALVREARAVYKKGHDK
ncbi:MAG: hypothetical protein NTX71_07795 [Candidatus Aureabacteria bacterium]|nr:hypothetical protein [Candidatus Auribacterota bacterium]